jgi:Phage tail tube protein
MRSGLGAQLGVATETTVGTFKAPTRFFPFESESLSLEKNYVKSAGLRAGRMSQAENLHRATTRTVGGDFNIEFFDQGMGVLLNQLHGNTVTPTKLEEKSKKVFKQVHEIGLTDPFGKALTVQVGRPDTANTVQPFSYLGCKIVEYKLSIEAGGIASLSISVDGTDELTSQSLGSASYDADALPFTFQQMVAKIGGSSIGNVRSIDLSVAVGMNTERFHLGNKGVKDQAIVNELLAVTADATLEFANLNDHNRYTEEKVVELALLGTGAEIGTEGETFAANFTLPAAKQVSSSPMVSGPDVLTTDVTFEALDNGTKAPLTAELLSTDTAI